MEVSLKALPTHRRQTLPLLLRIQREETVARRQPLPLSDQVFDEDPLFKRFRTLLKWVLAVGGAYPEEIDDAAQEWWNETVIGFTHPDLDWSLRRSAPDAEKAVIAAFLPNFEDLNRAATLNWRIAEDGRLIPPA